MTQSLKVAFGNSIGSDAPGSIPTCRNAHLLLCASYKSKHSLEKGDFFYKGFGQVKPWTHRVGSVTLPGKCHWVLFQFSL